MIKKSIISCLSIGEKIKFISYFFKKHEAPPGATIFITRKCNFSCSYCKVGNYKSEDISKEHWFTIIDKLSDWGVIIINIVGGEPTLRPDLCELINYAYEKRIFTIVHSNFSLMTTKIIDEFSRARLFALTASLDSFNGFGKSNYSVYKYLDYAKSKRIIPIISSVVTSENIEEIPRLAKFVISKGILYNFGLYQNIGGLFSPKYKTLIPPKDKLNKVMSKLRTLKKRTKGIRTTNNFLKTENLSLYYKKWKCNPSENNWIIINNDGHLMCCEEYTSNFDILNLKSLEEKKWIDYKTKTVNSCPGCYHHCYFDAETLKGIRILKEFKGIIRNLMFS